MIKPPPDAMMAVRPPDQHAVITRRKMTEILEA